MTKEAISEKRIVYGRQPVFELLRSRCTPRKVWLARETEQVDRQRIQKLCSIKNCELEELPKANLQRITGAVLHQGFAAELLHLPLLDDSEFIQLLHREKLPLVLVLDQVQDPHNMGAIFRTAEVAGVTALLLPEKGSAPLNATVAKTSAGALFHLSICRTNNLAGMLSSLKENGLFIFAAETGGNQSIYETEFHQPAAIVIGSEGQGVRKNLLRLCDEKIYIPQFGKVNSLNASVSAAIVLFEIVRQRKQESL